ncbi:MAG TPA: 2-C-methyl-D-erythritol 4-phosphate cytidylyltransferase [Planctomycetaceae bacterium]|nr:2-C-methyl-D-erythritol 4-phosphate cytidylyltransferase [Planctomycetaceae bacterium]|tara:strand:- start:14796 stop:15536 length:741 start_codon:yes stop_codon:yes gene_type:complete
MSRFAVILPAAGQSQRFKDEHYKKPFAPLSDRAVWLHTVEKFVNRDDVKQTIVVISPEDKSLFEAKFSANAVILGIDVVLGGDSRADSVANALKQVRDEIDYVAIHDAVRPCIASSWIDNVFKAAKDNGAAILAVPVTSTLKRVKDNRQIQETVSRNNLWEAQTPQVFRRDLLVKAFAENPQASIATDEAQLVEQIGHPVTVVEGSPSNMKITTKDDLRLAAEVLKFLPKPQRQGPAHPFGDDHWR